MKCPNCGQAGAVRRRLKVHCPNPGCASYDPELIPRDSAEDRELRSAEQVLAPPVWLRAVLGVVFLGPALLILYVMLHETNRNPWRIFSAAMLVLAAACIVFLPWMRFSRIKRSTSAARRKFIMDQALTGAIIFGILGIFAGGFVAFVVQLAGIRHPLLLRFPWIGAGCAALWGAWRAGGNASAAEDDEPER